MKMYFPAEVTSKTVLFFAVFIPWAIGFVGAGSGAKTLNLRIGFDLNQGKNGAPSLRIRDFQGSSELNPRAAEVEEGPKVIRADSFSDSKENQEKMQDDSNSKADSQSNSDEDASAPKESHVYNVRSTRGMRPGEYDPDDDGGVHGRYQDEEDDSDDGSKSETPLYAPYGSIPLSQPKNNLNESQIVNARRKRYKRKAENYEPTKRKGKKVRSFRKQVSRRMELQA